MPEGAIEDNLLGEFNFCHLKLISVFRKGGEIPFPSPALGILDRSYFGGYCPAVDAWTDYLSCLEEKFNEEGYNASLDGLTLTIKGKDNDSVPDNDIYYYEKFTEIEIDLT